MDSFALRSPARRGPASFPLYHAGVARPARSLGCISEIGSDAFWHCEAPLLLGPMRAGGAGTVSFPLYHAGVTGGPGRTGSPWNPEIQTFRIPRILPDFRKHLGDLCKNRR
jgi:hypothetical protein